MHREEEYTKRVLEGKKMEYLKVTGGKASPKREFRSARSRNHHHQMSMMNNIVSAITQVNGGDHNVVSETKEDGVVRMKIMVRKEDLRQMLEAMNGGKSNLAQRPPYSPSMSSLSIEQRLNLLRRKHLLRANSVKESRGRSWSPVLQSIPEEAVN